jgi:hypothetical protein
VAEAEPAAMGEKARRILCSIPIETQVSEAKGTGTVRLIEEAAAAAYLAEGSRERRVGGRLPEIRREEPHLW